MLLTIVSENTKNDCSNVEIDELRSSGSILYWYRGTQNTGSIYFRDIKSLSVQNSPPPPKSKQFDRCDTAGIFGYNGDHWD